MARGPGRWPWPPPMRWQTYRTSATASMLPASEGKVMRTWVPMGCGSRVSMKMPPWEMFRAMPSPQPRSPST